MPGSHAALTGRMMFDHKGIDYKRTDLLPAASWPVLKACRFPELTVPAAIIDGERIQGSKKLVRELERRRPEPPLFPQDPEAREAVEEAETFGDEILQQRVREIFLWAVGKDRSGLAGYLEGGKIGMPLKLAQLTAGPFIALDARVRGANDENVRAALEDFPGLLQQVDDWIEAGVLGTPELNAADLQIAPSICLAMTLDDLRPFIEGRPAGRYARQVVPHYPGRTPPVLPDEWLEPLRQETKNDARRGQER
jgi:glutathione S-transferase